MEAQVCGEPIGSPVFVYEAIDETGPMIGQEIHIVDCGNDTGAEISIPDHLSEAEVLIHDDIAAETVVRTTNVYHKPFLKDDSGDSGCSMEALEEEARFMDSQSSDCGLGELGCDIDTLHPPYGTPTWSSQEMCRVEDLSSSAGFVALVPDTILQGETTHSREASVREMAKREQDRLKKKKLRSNPAYRQMEKDKARARMKLRRLDPVFRSNERQRDKQRRKAARVRDIAKRIKEKERDKEHKRQKRVEAGAVLWTAEGFEDSYNSVVESIIGKHNTLENVTTQPRETFDGT